MVAAELESSSVTDSVVAKVPEGGKAVGAGSGVPFLADGDGAVRGAAMDEPPRTNKLRKRASRSHLIAASLLCARLAVPPARTPPEDEAVAGKRGKNEHPRSQQTLILTRPRADAALARPGPAGGPSRVECVLVRSKTDHDRSALPAHRADPGPAGLAAPLCRADSGALASGSSDRGDAHAG